jgi:uncharacterized protein YdaU (DUF1376 family)
MHYYQFNIGDYRRDTAHLSLLEHGIYRQLIDWYYLDEQPIPKETQVVYRRLSARTQEEQNAVDIVLKEFFSVDDGSDVGHVHRRIDRDIAEYNKKCDHNRAVGKLGGRPKKTDMDKKENPEKTQVVSENNPNHKPLTNNQEPETNNQEPDQPKVKSRGATATRLPADWRPDEVDIAYLKARRPDLNVTDVEENFRDYWIAQPGIKGRKADWHATWKTWVRNEKRNTHRETVTTGQTRHDRIADNIAKLTGQHKRERQQDDDPRIIHGTAERLD